MSLLQRIIEHFQNLVLVSDISMTLMGVSIILMSLAYFYCVIIKKNKYENIIVVIGVIIRILMVIGFTIEFSHQKAIYEGVYRLGGDLKFDAAKQILNYLFYGYIFVIGIYDIYTIGINKFRGFFHAFDLTMVSIPLLYGLTGIVLNFQFTEKAFLTLLVLAYFMVFPYLFFKLYWKQNLKWYVIFLVYCSIPLSYIVVKLFNHEFYMGEFYLLSVPISYFLLGLYELCRLLFNRIKERFSFNAWKVLKIISIICPVLLIYSSFITLNITSMQIDKTYNVDGIYMENLTFTSLEEAKNLARIAVQDTTSDIKLWQGTSEDFNNRYMFSIGNYSVDIDGATGKVFEIRTEKDDQIEIYEVIDEDGIKGKTIKWLKSIGFTYDEKKLYMNVEKQSNKNVVNIYNKFNDDSIDKNHYCSVQWNTNGRLDSANLGRTSFNITDYKEIKIDENVIREKINLWYEKLGEEVPPYLLVDFSYWFGEKEPSISILCKNDDRFQINSENGEVLSFSRNTNKKHNGEDDVTKMSEEDYNKFKDKAEKMATLFSTNRNEFNYKPKEGNQASNERGCYYFEGRSNTLNKYLIIDLDSQGKMIHFSEAYRWINKYSDKDFKVSSSTALKLVSDKYKPFCIYTKRVKLAMEIKEDGKVNYKWMVMVIPFKDVEHQIYYVDTETGEVTSLLSYGGN